jgi:hypothetical protein
MFECRSSPARRLFRAFEPSRPLPGLTARPRPKSRYSPKRPLRIDRDTRRDAFGVPPFLCQVGRLRTLRHSQGPSFRGPPCLSSEYRGKGRRVGHASSLARPSVSCFLPPAPMRGEWGGKVLPPGRSSRLILPTVLHWRQRFRTPRLHSVQNSKLWTCPIWSSRSNSGGLYVAYCVAHSDGIVPSGQCGRSIGSGRGWGTGRSRWRRACWYRWGPRGTSRRWLCLWAARAWNWSRTAVARTAGRAATRVPSRTPTCIPSRAAT